jgi:hypothetical protein
MRACEHCGVSVEGRRRHARYCGGPCRAAASRRRAAESRPDPAPLVEQDHHSESAQKRTEESTAQLATAEQEELIAYFRVKYPELWDAA